MPEKRFKDGRRVTTCLKETLTLLTRDARIEPPIQALNLRSTVVLLAINFKRILCTKDTKQSVIIKSNKLIYSKSKCATYWWRLLRELSVKSVCKALDECISSCNYHTAI